MTGRQRIEAVLRRKATDGLPWGTIVDNATLALLPSELQGRGGIDFYRHLGCSTLLLNGWNTPHQLLSPVLRWPDFVATEVSSDGPRHTTVWRTPRGCLTSLRVRGHPVKFPVDSLEAVHTYREMWEGATYQAVDDGPALARIDALLGDNGTVTRFWGPSAIPRLLELDMGTENFYYLLHDHPDETDGLIGAIHACLIEAFDIIAAGPWESANLAENTSTFYISPRVYEQYNMPHQRDFVSRVKAHGKVALLHMCGHVHALLPLIKETGCDGIHFLTPPPTGDTPWEDALDVIGEELIVIGALDPTIWVSGPINGIGPALDRLITPRLYESHFVLHPCADGIPVPQERFEAIRSWMDENGI
jgi:hypothetical protein